jgi:polysaccharide pyruvyl transferase WcaK-like protein
MRILLKGYYGFGNFGDDILMLTSYCFLKEKFPSAEISVFSNFTENLAAYNRHKNYNQYVFEILGDNVPLIDWTYTGHFDLIFNGGGGVFFDAKSGGILYRVLNFFLGTIGAKQAFQLEKFLRFIFKKPSGITFKKQIGVGIGIGPHTPGSILFGRHLSSIGSFDTLIVRDQKSFDSLRDLKFNGQKYLFTDLAFLVDSWRPQILKEKKTKTYEGKIGIVLQDFDINQPDKFAVIKEFVAKLKDVTFFSMDKNHDQKFIEEFSGNNLIVWEPDKMKMFDFMKSLSDQDVLFSARAHGAIIGAALGVIPVCLGVSQKLIEVSKYFPKGGKLVGDPFSSDTLYSCLETIVTNYAAMRLELENEVHFNESVARACLIKLDTLL